MLGYYPKISSQLRPFDLCWAPAGICACFVSICSAACHHHALSTSSRGLCSMCCCITAQVIVHFSVPRIAADLVVSIWPTERCWVSLCPYMLPLELYSKQSALLLTLNHIWYHIYPPLSSRPLPPISMFRCPLWSVPVTADHICFARPVLFGLFVATASGQPNGIH